MRSEIDQNFSNYTHHYLGSVTALMGSGCEVKTLNFSNYLYAIKIYGISYEIQHMIQVLFNKNVTKF